MERVLTEGVREMNEWLSAYLLGAYAGAMAMWALYQLKAYRKFLKIERQEKEEREEKDLIHMTERWEQAFAEDMECVLHHLPGDCPLCGAE